MKIKHVFILFLVVLGIGMFCTKFYVKPSKKIPAPLFVNQTSVPTHSPVKNVTSSIFIPYWSTAQGKVDPQYSSYYYFGIRPNRDGSIEDELGYQKVVVMQEIPENQKKLALRLLDPSITEVFLTDSTAQKKLISEVKKILIGKMFSGIILDIEVPFTFNQNKKEQITQLVQNMCTAVKEDYKTCRVLIYGDFSYRNRPYDLKKIGEAVDTILLMAYDFHPPSGEPGPNFPLSRRNVSEGGPETLDYGYDFKQMVADARALVPVDKIEVVFGMYGYDWTLNEQGIPLKEAKALTLKELKSTIQNSEKAQASSFKLQTNDAKEKSIQYIDEEGRKHIIWYEDEESAAIKTKYLQSQGIWHISYWAYSYF